jgi:hypothetical protein
MTGFLVTTADRGNVLTLLKDVSISNSFSSSNTRLWDGGVVGVVATGVSLVDATGELGDMAGVGPA